MDLQRLACLIEMVHPEGLDWLRFRQDRMNVAKPFKLLTQRRCDALWAIVRANMSWRSMMDEELA